MKIQERTGILRCPTPGSRALPFVSKAYCLALFLNPVLAQSQGTFIYDQQSATESTGGGGYAVIQSNQPIGQSFTPSFDSVGFVRLHLYDPVVNGSGAGVYLDLWAGSFGGTLLGSTDPIHIADGFAGFADFFFPSPVAVVPGTTYYFQPIVQQGGDNVAVLAYNTYHYDGGMFFANGEADPSFDMWFREGLYVVPEPSPVWLLLVGSMVFGFRAHRLRGKTLSGR